MPPERGGSVAGIVLAAGASTRMGRNKLFLQIDGKTLLRRAVECARAAGLDPVIVVLGHDADRAEREVAGLSCRTVLNRDHASGMHTSFRAGISAVPESSRAAVVLLPDMPRVGSDMVAALVARYRSSAAPLVISEYGGVHAPPTLYDRCLFEEIRGMEGDGCGKQVVRRHRGEAEAVAWPESRMADLDVPEDVEHWRASGAEDATCAQTS
jgi:molybdenum cofactor cytidylyltransferase